MVPFDRGERGEPWREALSFFEILKATGRGRDGVEEPVNGMAISQ